MNDDKRDSGITRREFAIGAGAAVGAMAAAGAVATPASAQQTGKASKGHLLMTSVWAHERSWEGVQEDVKTNDIIIMPIHLRAPSSAWRVGIEVAVRRTGPQGRSS